MILSVMGSQGARKKQDQMYILPRSLWLLCGEQTVPGAESRVETDVRIQARDEVVWKDGVLAEGPGRQHLQHLLGSIADGLADGWVERERKTGVKDDHEFAPDMEEPGWARCWWGAR